MPSSKIYGDKATTSRSRASSFEMDKGNSYNPSASAFYDKFSNEANELRKRRESLSIKLAKAQQSKISQAEKRELIEEFSLIQSTQKLLEHIANSMTQAMQGIAANFR